MNKWHEATGGQNGIAGYPFIALAKGIYEAFIFSVKIVCVG